jgi:DNA primase
VTRAVNSARKNAPAKPDERPRDASAQPQESEARQAEFSLTDLPVDPPTRQERDALMAILQHPSAVGRELLGRVCEVRFQNRTLSVVRDAIAVNADRLDAPDWVATITNEVPPSLAGFVQQLAVAPILEREDRIPTYCVRLARDLIVRDLVQRKAELLGAMQRVDKVAEPEKYRELQEQSASVEYERQRLRED